MSSLRSIDKMTSQQIDIGRGGSIHAYGYGLGIGDRLIGYSGGIVGFKSQFVLDRETKTLIVVFSNNAGTNATDIAFGLLTILFTPSL